MKTRIYKEVCFDATHRLLHYEGKCRNLHGHRWKVEVWIVGEIDEETKILVDYNTIKGTIERFDHQVILNESDPMVPCVQQFQNVITTPGDPTSELLAGIMVDLLNQEITRNGSTAQIVKIRVWESPTCYAELTY
ncbi:MAG TPA: 6-carboxytetrahydropterin synthase, partial [Methanomicrobiales archaeon]|nr:6-carboxytetrahydropterin synthase [Methanomicrobiales archaeon]